MKIKRIFFDSALLIVYDLLRVISVLALGKSYLMGFNLVILFVLLVDKKLRINIKNYGFDLMIYLKTLIAILVSFISITIFNANAMLFFLGAYLSIVPMLAGFLFSKKIELSYFAKIVFPAAIIDLILSVLFFKELGIYQYLGSIGEMFKSTLVFRMGLNGSLRFGNFMLIGFVLACYYNSILIIPFMIGIIFSLQRSAWLGMVITLVIMQIVKLSKINIIGKIAVLLCCVAIAVCGTSMLFSNADNFFYYRIISMVHAPEERVGQWINAWELFLEQPIGRGVGQIGHTVRISNALGSQFGIPIPDGDYFRILTEEGFFGLLFFVVILLYLIKKFFYLKCDYYKKEKLVIINLIIVLMIQMIGSNVTEFNFNNFLFWTIIGFFFKYWGVSMKNDFRKYFSGFKLQKGVSKIGGQNV